MSVFLIVEFLFFAGSLIGWGIEVVWRRFLAATILKKNGLIRDF